MRTLVGSDDGRERIRAARLAWIAEVLRSAVAAPAARVRALRPRLK